MAAYKYLQFTPAPAVSDVARITETSTSYATLGQAVAAVTEGQTITLQKSVTENIIIPSTNASSFTLDLNGNALDGGTKTAILHQGSGTLTLADSSMSGLGYVIGKWEDVYTPYGVIMLAGGSLTMTGGTVSAGGSAGNGIYNASADHPDNLLKSDGTLKILGGKVSATGFYGSGVLSFTDTMVTISGDRTRITSAAQGAGCAAVRVDNSTSFVGIALEITGGTVEATALKYNQDIYAVFNADGGKVIIKGGAVTIQGAQNAVNKAPDLSQYSPAPTVIASESFDGSSPVPYDPSFSKITSYKYLRFALGAFVPVQSIGDVSTVGVVGMPMSLSGTVTPANATNKTIVWSLGNGSTAPGAAVSNGRVSATGAGTVAVTATIINGSTASTDYTQNFTVTFSEGAPAQPTVMDVEMTPFETTIKRGGTQQFTATVRGTGNFDNTVTWSVEGNNYTGTSISRGFLLVYAGETAASITVKATSTADPSKFATATVNVSTTQVTKYLLSVLNGTGGDNYTAGTKVLVTANAPSREGLVFDKWTATAGTLANAAAPTTTFTMPAGAATVTATYKEAATPPPTVTAVWIDPLSVYVDKGESKQFTAQVKGTNSPSQEVTWTVTGGVAGTTIVDGLLTVAAEETAASLTVKATSTLDTSQFGTALVYVGAAPPTPTAVISGSPAIVVGESNSTSFILTTTNVPVGTSFLVLGPPPTGTLPLGIFQNTFSTTGDVTTVSLSAVGSECDIGTFPLRVRLTGHASLLETSAGVTLVVSKAQTPPTRIYPLEVLNGTQSGGYLGGTPVTITADPAPSGQRFKQWVITSAVTFLDGTNEQSATAKFTMPEEGVSAQATYEDIPVSVTGVTINPTVTSVQKGTTQQFTATVSGTGSFVNTVNWAVIGGGAGTSITDGLLSVAAGETATQLTVKATATADTNKFAVATITVTDIPVITNLLTVTGGTGGGNFAEGAQIAIAANMPAVGKVFDKWVLTSGGGTLADANSATTTYTMPANAATVTATYQDAPIDHHTITASAGTGGTISPSGSVRVTNGGSQTFTISASGHYSIASVTVDGVNQGAIRTYTFSDVTGNHTISAAFTYNGSSGGSTGGGSAWLKPAEPKIITGDGFVTVTIAAEVKTNGATATATVSQTLLNDALKAVPRTAKPADMVTIEVTAQTPKNAQTVEIILPKTGLSALGDSQITALTISSGVGNFTLSKAACAAIAGQVEGDTVKMTVSKVNVETTLNARQRAAVGDAPVYDISIASGTKSISSFDAGSITVSLPYALKEGQIGAGVVMWYLNENGTVEKLPTVYDAKTKTATFAPSHFSLYVIGYDAVAALPNPFSDVAENAYYRNPAVWAADNGVTGGTGADTFSPNATCTRAQTVTFLWRAMGSPEPAATVNPFTDVDAGAYYYKAVLWAAEKGITAGSSATTFSPDATVSRGQVATFLWRAADKPAASKATSFTDVSADAYYADAVLWAAEKGITSGTSATTFSPANHCTRGQIVTFLYWYFGK